jgi:hypothetical protein
MGWTDVQDGVLSAGDHVVTFQMIVNATRGFIVNDAIRDTDGSTIVSNVYGPDTLDGLMGPSGGSSGSSGLTTAYSVDFTTLSGLDLLTGGDGAKTIDGKTWNLRNSANATSAYLNDGTHSGLYIKCSAISTDYRGSVSTAPLLLAGLQDLTGVGMASCVEQWVLTLFNQPHTPNANYEGCKIGVRLIPPVIDATKAYKSATVARVYGDAVYGSSVTFSQLSSGSVTFKFNYSGGASDTFVITGAQLAALAVAQGFGGATSAPNLNLTSLMPGPSSTKLISTIETTIVGIGPNLSAGQLQLHIDSNSENSTYAMRTGINANSGPVSESGQSQHFTSGGTCILTAFSITGIITLQSYCEFHKAGAQTRPSAECAPPLTTDDVYAFRILNDNVVEIYSGASVGGDFPALSALRLVAQACWLSAVDGFTVISTSIGGSNTLQWACMILVLTGNTAGNSDLLIKKLQVLQR